MSGLARAHSAEGGCKYILYMFVFVCVCACVFIYVKKTCVCVFEREELFLRTREECFCCPTDTQVCILCEIE